MNFVKISRNFWCFRTVVSEFLFWIGSKSDKNLFYRYHKHSCAYWKEKIKHWALRFSLNILYCPQILRYTLNKTRDQLIRKIPESTLWKLGPWCWSKIYNIQYKDVARGRGVHFHGNSEIDILYKLKKNTATRSLSEENIS